MLSGAVHLRFGRSETKCSITWSSRTGWPGWPVTSLPSVLRRQELSGAGLPRPALARALGVPSGVPPPVLKDFMVCPVKGGGRADAQKSVPSAGPPQENRLWLLDFFCWLWNYSRDRNLLVNSSFCLLLVNMSLICWSYIVLIIYYTVRILY